MITRLKVIIIATLTLCWLCWPWEELNKGGWNPAPLWSILGVDADVLAEDVCPVDVEIIRKSAEHDLKITVRISNLVKQNETRLKENGYLEYLDVLLPDLVCHLEEILAECKKDNGRLGCLMAHCIICSYLSRVIFNILVDADIDVSLIMREI